MPLISVIVPAYNVEKYLPKCIDSILNQTFTDFELILVDDGSPDKSGSICDEYAAKDKRIKVIHKENGGVSTARNAGLNIASGEYITFCDGDDYYAIDWLEKFIKSVNESTSDLIIANYTRITEFGEIIRSAPKTNNSWTFSNQNDYDSFILNNVFASELSWEVCKSLFKRELIEKNKIRFNLKCKNYAEDMCFFLQYVLFCKKIQYIDNAGYYYVRHDNSMMSTSKVEIKLDSLNEVSYEFGQKYLQLYKDKRMLSVIHYAIMFTEYHKLMSSPQFGYKTLNKQIKLINNQKYFNSQSIFLLFSLSLLKKYSQKRMFEFQPIARYTIHRIGVLFKLDNYISYKKLNK